MKITLDLTKNEIRALLSVVYKNPCEATCVWDECKKASDCDTCAFTKARDSLLDKIDDVTEQYDFG